MAHKNKSQTFKFNLSKLAAHLKEDKRETLSNIREEKKGIRRDKKLMKEMRK